MVCCARPRCTFIVILKGQKHVLRILVLFSLLQCTSICCVVKRSGHIYVLGLGEGQILWSEKMIEGISISHSGTRRSIQSGHLSMQKTMNILLKMTIQLLKQYLELVIYRCKNDEHTPKKGDFNQKNDESIL